MLTRALAHLVEGIVHHPEGVQVQTGKRPRTYHVRVHPEDLGRVIGRQGRTVEAIRTVINALPGGRGVRVDILDEDPRQVGRR